MLERIHFISGLPRSGSTLLAAVLRQNPRFHADVTGPVALLCSVMHQKIADGGEFATQFDDERCARMLRGVFESYYADVAAGRVILDTNRTWTSRAALLGRLFPASRIICCVRDIGWIIDSLERLRVRNPLRLSKIFTAKTGATLYTRVEALMHSESGLIGAAWSMLREAWFSESAPRLVVIPYEGLVREPARTLQRLYQALGEPEFAHDFRRVQFESRAYDDSLGMPGMHTVRPVVEYQEREPAIPPDIFSKYANTAFWSRADQNPRRVLVL